MKTIQILKPNIDISGKTMSYLETLFVPVAEAELFVLPRKLQKTTSAMSIYDLTKYL